MDWSNIKYFKEAEFKCKHCGECEIDQELVEKLDAIRHLMGVPLTVTSGYRCPVHNSNVSATGTDGPHTTGKAADIGISGEKAREFLGHAVKLFNGIGVQQKGNHASRFIHVDLLSPRLWSY